MILNSLRSFLGDSSREETSGTIGGPPDNKKVRKASAWRRIEDSVS